MGDSTITRTYRFKKETVEQIDRLSAQLQCHQSPLIDMLVQRALTEVETGRWVVRKEPVKYVAKW